MEVLNFLKKLKKLKEKKKKLKKKKKKLKYIQKSHGKFSIYLVTNPRCGCWFGSAMVTCDHMYRESHTPLTCRRHARVGGNRLGCCASEGLPYLGRRDTTLGMFLHMLESTPHPNPKL